MRTSDRGLALIKSFEGCKLTAYPDPGSGGDPWTIGYGHTGPEVVPGLTIDQQQADDYLVEDVRKFEDCVDDVLEVEVTQEQFDSLVCFSFNVGCGALKGSSLLRLVNARNTAGAASQFMRWNKAGGRVMAGLTRRRMAERNLFLS